MNKRIQHQTLSACALAATLFLAACGGGTSTDTVPPTVAITSAAATGSDVIFTFTFSEALSANTFTVDDIVVTGGTAGTFIMVDSSHATLVVTPSSGALSASVAANKFDDVAHNFNTAAASNTYTPPASSPSTAAPTPTRAAADVLSIYSDAYTPTAGVDLNPNWGQSGFATNTQTSVAGNNTRSLTFFNYQGIDFTGNPVDVSAKTGVHIDVWTPNVAELDLFVISSKAGVTVDTVKYAITPTLAGWNSIDIPLSAFAGVDLTSVTQFKFTNGPTVAAGGTLYYDNLYFYKTTTTPVTPAGTQTITFESNDTSGYALGGAADFNGASSSLSTNPPAGGNGNAAKVTVAAGSQYHGTTFLTLAGAEVCTTAKPNISVHAYTPAAGTSVELKLEQDGDPTKNIELRQNTTVAGWETLTFSCLVQAPVTAPYVEATVYNKMSILFDFPNQNAGVTYYFDDVSFMPTAATTYVKPVTMAAPTAAAATPSKAAGNVISLFSDAYTNVTGTDFFPNWGQASVVSDVTIAGNATKKIATLNYEGIQLTGATNVSAMTNLHIDTYTDCLSLDISLINSSAVATPAVEKLATVTPTLSTWSGFDIPLSSYSSVVNLTKVDQLKFVCTSPVSNSTLYFDNLYFWK